MNRTFQITITEEALTQILSILNGESDTKVRLFNPRLVENQHGDSSIVVASLVTDENDDIIKYKKDGLIIQLDEADDE